MKTEFVYIDSSEEEDYAQQTRIPFFEHEINSAFINARDKVDGLILAAAGILRLGKESVDIACF